MTGQDTIVKATVKLLCPVNYRQASQGSGTVIDSSGAILTNKHVVAGTLGCLVGFINDFNDEPYFGERHIADIVRVSPSQDVALLKLRNPQNRPLSSIDVARGNKNPRLGSDIAAYGFPAKFGTKLTYTSGDFSGTDGAYLKTTTILEHGNSGGGAYLRDGSYIGIPSAVVKGELNALGYILSINTINAWTNNAPLAQGDTMNNRYSRVSVLEDIDLNKLDSLELFIPKTNKSGDLVGPPPARELPPVTDTENVRTQQQPNSAPEESIVIEPEQADPHQDAIQDASTTETNEAVSETKPSWWKRLFRWFANLFR
ncbi:MAG: serine protease [bacterium]|nr:serine protease [bacterium]